MTADKGQTGFDERVRRLKNAMTDPLTVTVTELRRRPGHCIDLVADRPAIITRHGKPVAALISIEMSREIEAIEQLAAEITGSLPGHHPTTLGQAPETNLERHMELRDV